MRRHLEESVSNQILISSCQHKNKSSLWLQHIAREGGHQFYRWADVFHRLLQGLSPLPLKESPRAQQKLNASKTSRKFLGWQRVTLPKLKLLLNTPHTLRIYSVNVPLPQVLLYKFLFIRPQGGPSIAGLPLLIRDNRCRIMTSWHYLCHIYIKATPLPPPLS